MDLEFWAATDVGRVRDHNEDNFLVDKRLKLFVVCDGMGGHAAGEVASAMSVKVVREVFSASREVFEKLDQDPDHPENRKAVLALCERAIQEACQRIYHAAQEDAGRRGMGTTCSLLVLHDGRGFIGHVGDSRVYLARNNQIHQITEDHSLINEMLRLGKIKPGEEHLLPHKNAVTRAVGVNEFVEVDTFELDVFSGDEFLLCSDGLCGYFHANEEILGMMGHSDIRAATETFIQFANEAGGKDNITTILVRVSGEVGKRRHIQQAIDIMRQSPLFQYLAYKELVQVLNLSERIEIKAGELACDGHSNDGLFLVLSGQLEVERRGDGLGFFSGGSHFGDHGLVDEDATPLRAMALEQSQIMVIRRGRFLELLRQEPDLAVKLLWNFLQSFSRRLRDAEARIPNSEPEDMADSTPASGVLVFEEDLRETATIDTDQTIDINAAREELRNDFSQAQEESVSFGGEPLDPDATLAPGSLAPNLSSVKEENTVDWDGLEALISSGDDDEEDLRKTVRIDELKSRGDEAKFSGISGESVVKDNLPRAQVLKRTKLTGDTATETNLAERLKEKRANLKKSDRS